MSKSTESAAKGDVQEKADKEHEQGFVGTKVDPRPNSDYSLESGPDSPSAVDSNATRVAQPDVNKEG